VITDFGDMDEAREWQEKIEQEANYKKKPQTNRIFSHGFHQAPHIAHK
jgi:hypothetical protein